MELRLWRHRLLIGDSFLGKKEKEVKKQQTPAVSQKNKAQGKLCDCLNVLVPRCVMAGFDLWVVK